ncbi:hypothetical protein [Fluviicola chungangensis]|uniref:Uncharacterized protein n=1 Tax=Fluviicola chungangensis TaxID=2597671 RepID=A0A556MMV8_9FLAO|nr:hypothetical protein [Fluviicola chungangensis]TSJ41274.1 hypothetical protein FO442_15295 [Fluviicola chungangensis]
MGSDVTGKQFTGKQLFIIIGINVLAQVIGGYIVYQLTKPKTTDPATTPPAVAKQGTTQTVTTTPVTTTSEG